MAASDKTQPHCLFLFRMPPLAKKVQWIQGPCALVKAEEIREHSVITDPNTRFNIRFAPV